MPESTIRTSPQTGVVVFEQPAIHVSSPTVERTRAALVAIVIVVSSIVGLAVVLSYPRPDAAGQYTFAQIEPMRDAWWAFFILAGVNLILGNVALAVAIWRLVRTRGAAWATLGGAMLWVGAALYGVGVGGWATIGYYATNPAAVDPANGARLVDYVVGDVSRMYGAVLPGGVLVLGGTVAASVALWQARTVPRWVPILLASLLATFVLPTRGPVGLVSELPHLIASMAIAWSLWRRAGQRNERPIAT